MFRNMLPYLCLLMYLSVQVLAISTPSCRDYRNRDGNCVHLDSCPSLTDEYYQSGMSGYGINYHSFILKSTCNINGVSYLVCCKITPNDRLIMAPIPKYNPNSKQESPGYELPPDFDIRIMNPDADAQLPRSRPSKNGNAFRPRRPVQRKPIFEKPQQADEPDTSLDNPKTANGNCGTHRVFNNRVVGGMEATKGNYPWVAALGFKISNDLQFLCAGSLISPKHVLTGAHCISKKLEVVRLGAHDLRNDDEPNARNYNVKHVVVHEEYDPKTVANDLAIIELTENVMMTRFINTVCLPDETTFPLEDLVGKNPFVAGWGAQRFRGRSSNVLRDVQVPVISREECVRNYQPYMDISSFSERVICAGNHLVDSCQGDSGGPLMMPMQSSFEFRYYVIGVVSFGRGCARDGYPGIYTKVDAYLPWIRNNMY